MVVLCQKARQYGTVEFSFSDNGNIIESGEMWKLWWRSCCSACTKPTLLWSLPRRQGVEKKKRTRPASQRGLERWGEKNKKITQSVSVRAADKQVLGFPKLKRHGCPRALAPMKQTPLLCEQFRDGSILLFWALTSRSEGGYDSAACSEK